MLIVSAWSSKSHGARLIAKRFKGKLLHHLQEYPTQKDVLLNWGSHSIETSYTHVKKIINKPDKVHEASEKVSFFTIMGKDVRVPEWTTDYKTALKWVKDGSVVVGRKYTNASGGKGITFIDDLDSFVQVPLYTKYIPKKHEFRVHIGFGKVFDIQKKLLRKHDEEGQEIDPTTIDHRLRSHSNGFIFARNDIETPKDVLDQALASYNKLGLDFGAFDVIYQDSSKRAYVLEVNTAPGLEGTTADNYLAMLEKEIKV